MEGREGGWGGCIGIWIIIILTYGLLGGLGCAWNFEISSGVICFCVEDCVLLSQW